MDQTSTTDLKQRPCLEEFVAAGYDAENYDSYFERLGGYGPGWSDPNWTPPSQGELNRALPEAIADLPPFLLVHDRSQHPSTRTQRIAARQRPRDRQYLFGNPAKRLVPARPLRITREELLSNLPELIRREHDGLISVHVLYGARLDLKKLGAGQVVTQGRPPASPAPIVRPDSIANDKPWGNQLPQYLGGTFQGDPAAERALERMTKEKEDELERKSDAPPADPAAERATATEAETELPPPPPIPETVPTESEAVPPGAVLTSASSLPEIQEQDRSSMEEQTASEDVAADPAAARAESKKSKKGSKK